MEGGFTGMGLYMAPGGGFRRSREMLLGMVLVEGTNFIDQSTLSEFLWTCVGESDFE